MGLTAVVMAGGKAKRMKLEEEKPLLSIQGRPMIHHVINALKSSCKIDRVVVATSKHTPRTAIAANRLSVTVVETPGTDYVSDMRYVLRKLGLGATLVVSADLPLITGDLIDLIVEHYQSSNKPSLTVMVPERTCTMLGLKANYIRVIHGEPLVPTGINIIDGRRIDSDEVEEDVLVVDKIQVAVNVNTIDDLQTAGRIIKRPV